MDGDFRLHPYATASVEALNDGKWAAVTRFVGQDATAGFKAVTPLPSVLGQFDIGAELGSGSDWELRAGYGMELGAGYTAQTASLRFGLKF